MPGRIYQKKKILWLHLSKCRSRSTILFILYDLRIFTGNCSTVVVKHIVNMGFFPETAISKVRCIYMHNKP